MKLGVKLALGISVLLGFVSESYSINCYYCNSANNSACIDLNEYDEELRTRLIPVVHCETSIPSPVALSFFCRKIVQTIFHANRENELRVTRGCGWIHSERECYKANNEDHLETVCQCFTDYCNSSDRVNPTTISGIFILFSIVLYLYR